MSLERIYIGSVEQSNAINAAADPECDRDMMASFYADCLRVRNDVDWRAVNEAVLKRWFHDLIYIKTRAWKLLER